jgi:CelD/BcsL family acetyltransferase involved in cellulose biosynthesis
MKTIIFTTLDTAVMKQWEDLWHTSPFANYTNSPFWFRAGIETFNYQQFVIIAVYDGENLVGIAGLVKEKKYGITFSTVAPSDFVCGVPFLIDPENTRTMHAFGKELQKLGTVCLANIPEDFVTMLQAAVPGVEIASSTVNYYVDVQKNEQGAVEVRHKRRLLRRSEMIEAALALRSFSGSDSEALQVAFAIDQESNKQTRGYNAFASSQTQTFYQSLAKYYQKQFHLYILYHHEKPVAYQIGFLVGKSFFCSQIAFVKEYGMYSIGRSLLIRLIEKLGTAGVAVIDFGSGEDHVKKSLAKQQRMLHSLIISPSRSKRIYLKQLDQTKSYLYAYLHEHVRLYTTYRKLKNILQRGNA